MSGTSKVSSAILSFFKDPDASDILTLAGNQVLAPTVRGQDLTDAELSMGGGVRLVMHIFDRSPSMEPATKLMLEGFGGDYVEAIKEARGDDIAALRIAGVSFSSDITPIWVKGGTSFHALEKLPPLTRAEYNPSNGNGTALHQAIIDGYNLALNYAAQIQQDTGIQPEIDIPILSDGMNNERPHDPDVIRTLIKGSKKELVRWIFFYFETNPGGMNPEDIAKDLGFDSENIMGFAKKPGETEAEHKKRFRRMLRVMSRVSASKGTSAVKAAAVVSAAAASGPDDLL
jgi:hypothetical protein